MKSKMNRALSMLFALVMVVTVFPVMTSTATAAEQDSNLAASDLYVMDGVTLWLTAAGVDLANGKWTSDVGDLSATLLGGVYNAESNKLGWRLNSYGAPYYRVQEIGSFAGSRTSTGIVLPVAAISDGDFTFETVYTPLYLSTEAGEIVPHSTADIPSKWGAYAQGVHSMFTIAGLQMCFFHPSISGSGNSSRMRLYYHPSAWEATSPSYGCPNNKSAHVDVTPFGGYSAEEDTLTKTPVTMSVVRKNGAGSLYTLTRFYININGLTHVTHNGDGRDAFTTSANVHCRFYTLAELAAEGGNNQPFSAFFGFPAEVYGIRVYNRALSQDEVNRNHLADLISVLGVEVSKQFYNGLSDLDRTSFLEAISLVRIQDGKAAAQNVIDTFEKEYAELASFMTDYDKLYVKDGLVQLLSAFTKSEAETVISTGAWQNKVSAGKDGTLINHHGSLVGWKALDNGGIGYDLTLSDLSAGNARNMYIDLGNDVVNIDETWNYTVEYVAKIMRTTEGGDNGHNTSYTNEKFGMWGSWSYRAGSWRLLCHGYGTETHWGHGVGWYTDANFSSTSQIKTVANRMLSTSNNGVMDGARYIYANGEQKSAYTGVVANNKGPYTTICRQFFIMRNVANETYAVRVYERALSDEELLRNSVVDRWAYNGINVSGLVGASDVAVMQAVNACKDIPFAASAEQKTAMQNAVNAAVALYEEIAKVEMNAYDALYVQNGLSILLSAYDANDASLNLAGGLWYNKVEGEYNAASIVGGLYDASSNKMGWQKGEKGFYWTQRASVSTSNQKNGIYFDVNDLPEGSFTVEQVIAYDGITNDDGTKWDSTWNYKKVDGTDTGVSGNRYGYNVEAFAFGAVRTLSFISNKHYSQQVDASDNSVLVGNPKLTSDGAQNRWYYTGLSYGEHGSNPTGYGSALTGAGVDAYWQNFAAGEALSFTVSYAYVGGNTYDTADSAKFTVSYNGHVNVDKTIQAGGANKIYGYENTLIPNDAGYNKQGYQVLTNRKFQTMVGVAGSVYAVRVYDRALTEAEMRQNHAVDLMAYFNMDVTGFADASAEAKARVYEAFAEKNFQASALEVAVMQAAIDRAVEDSIVGVIVSQKSKDSTALRIVGALESMENVSRVGFVITFKQNGEVVKTFGEASVDNTATVTKTVFASVTADGVSYSASALCAEQLYIAVVQGVPAGTYTVEVTPFYVTLEGAVVTGEVKSAEITF